MKFRAIQLHYIGYDVDYAGWKQAVFYAFHLNEEPPANANIVLLCKQRLRYCSLNLFPSFFKKKTWCTNPWFTQEFFFGRGGVATPVEGQNITHSYDE